MSRWQKFRDIAPGVLKQLGLEAIGPALTATVWTVTTTPVGADLRTYIATATTAFAVSAYLWAQLWRIIKQQKQERGLSTITSKVDQLLQRLDDQVKDLIGFSTGGNAQVKVEVKDAGHDGKVIIDVVNFGIYPVYDMELTLMQVMMGHMKPGKIIGETGVRRVLQPGSKTWKAFVVSLPPGSHGSYTLQVDKRNGVTFHSVVVHRFDDCTIAVATDEHRVQSIPNNFPFVDPADPGAIFLRP